MQEASQEIPGYKLLLLKGSDDPFPVMGRVPAHPEYLVHHFLGNGKSGGHIALRSFRTGLGRKALQKT